MALSGFPLEVQEKSDILKVVSSFVDVIPKGSAYVAICPFHNDTNPSMNISPQRNIFKCFACGEGGDAITFVRKFLHTDFHTAVLKVAQICGIPIPDSTSFSTEAQKVSPAQKALDDLSDFYRMMLKSGAGKRAMDYLKGRGIDDATIQRFGIGYAPRDAQLAIRSLREKKGHSVSDLEEAGILAKGASDLRDRYSERIMFPIRDARGHTVGFSGRKYLPDDPSDSKYINSPETSLFVKSRILYNLDNAWSSAKNEGYLYVVEGFMDAIAINRAGIAPAVALMGTALTKDHLRIIKKLGVEVRLCLDSDDAGQLGERKIAPLLTQAGIPFRVVAPFTKEEGKDTDEVLDHHGSAFLKDKLSILIDPVTFRLNTIKAGGADVARQVDQVIESSAVEFQAMSPSEQQLLLERMSKLVGLSTSYLRNRFAEAVAGARATGEAVTGDTVPSGLIRLPNMTLNEAATLVSPAAELVKSALVKAGRDELVRLSFHVTETGIIFWLPTSPGACDMLFRDIQDRMNDFTIPMFSRACEILFRLKEEGKFGPDGLPSEYYSQIFEEMMGDIESNSDLYAGFDERIISGFWECCKHFAWHRPFDAQRFKRLLDRHLCARKRIDFERDRFRVLDPKELDELQERRSVDVKK